MDIKDLIRFLHEKNCKLKGCSTLEVKRIEKYFGVKLPDVYKEYLYNMGKGAGAYMEGSSAFYGEIFDLREDLESMLQEKGMSLPNNTFVFWAHQGYQFAFFYIDNEDNPPVYFYYEGVTTGDFEKKERFLTDFWEKQLYMSGLM